MKIISANSDKQDDQIPLRPHYVYCLIDPRTEKIFYIGKGVGTRALNHESEVMRMVATGKAIEGKKKATIAEINKLEQKVKILVLGRFETEGEAYAVEATLIHWVYGKENLTNEQSGHGVDFIRPIGNFSEISGIDIQKKAGGQNDGAYRNEKIEGLTIAGAYDHLNLIKEKLTEKDFSWRDFSDPIDRYMDPIESNGKLGLIITIHSIDFVLDFGKSLHLSITIGGNQLSPEANKNLAAIAKKFGGDFELSELKKPGRSQYYRFRKNVKFSQKNNDDNLSALINLLDKFKAL